MSRLSFASLMLASIGVPSGAQAQEARLPDWLAGCWEMRDGERWAEECWTIPRGDMMIGSARSGAGDVVSSFEHMRIERGEGGKFTLLASPGGNSWTPFASTAYPGKGVTFVNTANDFPQRVRYWREGELLKAEISLEGGGQAVRWTFARMGV